MTERLGSNGALAYREGMVAIDPSLRNWVFQFQGTTGLVGKIAGATEDEIKKELMENPMSPPCVTLLPVYLVTSQLPIIWHPKDGPIQIPRQVSCALFANCFFGRKAISRLNVQLTAFEWLSAQPDEPRRYVCMLLEKANEQYRIAEAGIVSGQSP